MTSPKAVDTQTCVRCGLRQRCGMTRITCANPAALSIKSPRNLAARDAVQGTLEPCQNGSIHRGYKRETPPPSTGSSASHAWLSRHVPHDSPSYPQRAVDDRLYERAFECSHSESNSEGRPAATETALSLRPVLRTKGAVVSMPTAHPNLSNQPAREHLEEPLPLSVCVAELMDQLTREGE